MCYSKATALRGALSTYTQIIRQTDPQVLELAAEYHQAVRELIAHAVTEKLTWQSPSLKEYDVMTERANTQFYSFVHESGVYAARPNRSDRDPHGIIETIEVGSDEMCVSTRFILSHFVAHAIGDRRAEQPSMLQYVPFYRANEQRNQHSA